LIDRVINITAPLSRMRNITFHVEVESDCPHHFRLENERFGPRFFQLHIGYLQLSGQLQNKHKQVFIEIDQSTTKEKKEYLKAGMNDILIKPARMKSLRAVMWHLGQPDASNLLAASGKRILLAFDPDLAFEYADDRHDLAAELSNLLMASLPRGLDAITAASRNVNKLKCAVHKFRGAVR